LPDTEKTLLYTACQDGNFEVVEYFLIKGLLPSIKSKTDENDFENCLDVAARWNYVEIVKLLLDKGNFSEGEIRQTLKSKNLTKSVKDLINSHLSSKNQSKKKKGCACF
jgi:ankyrin repeat protein